MKFTERKEWLYDPQVFGKQDVQTALRIHAEATRKHSAVPPPTFMEVDRRSAVYDQLWHVPLNDRTQFSRIIPVPAINTFERPDWRLTKVGIVPQRKDKFTLSNLILQGLDYFPMRGDMVSWNGYRYMVVNIALEPRGYWQQTNIWLGLVCECIIPPDGDARPLVDISKPPLAETAQTSSILQA